MRAAVSREVGAPLVMEDLDLAEPGPGTVRARIRAVAICHSDITYIDGGWGGDRPAVYGHEAAGEITAVGAGVTGLAPGDRVIITMIRHCGACPCCRRGMPGSCETPMRFDPSPLTAAGGQPVVQGLSTGAFAEEVVVHASQAVRIEGDLGWEVASLMACGVITGWGAVVNTAALTPGADAVVIGTGGVGLNAVQAARLQGAGRVIAVDLDPVKLAAAESFGATHCVNGREGDPVAQVRALTAGRGADFVFVTVGAPRAMDQSYAMLAPGGTAVIVGVAVLGATSTFDPVNLNSYSQRILGSKLAVEPMRDIPRLIGLYREGRMKLDELVSRRWGFDEINGALDAARRGEGLRNVVVMA